MPLVHPSAGVNYHGSMQLSRFTSSEDTPWHAGAAAFQRGGSQCHWWHFQHIPPTIDPWPAGIRHFWGRRASTLAFWGGFYAVLSVALLGSCEAVEQGWLLGGLHTPQPSCCGLPVLPLCLCSSPLSQPHCQSYSVCKCSYFYGRFMTLLCGTYNFNGWKSN